MQAIRRELIRLSRHTSEYVENRMLIDVTIHAYTCAVAIILNYGLRIPMGYGPIVTERDMKEALSRL